MNKGTLRYTDVSGHQLLFEPGDPLYKDLVPYAQEIFSAVTQSFIKLENNMPTKLEVSDSRYRVYLDGQIVPWWSAADSVRGFVDVCVGIDYRFNTFGQNRHRLFGVVKFEPTAIDELLHN